MTIKTIKKPAASSAAKGRRRKAFKAAFPYTIPIFAGFWFLGIAYGIYMSTSGFSFLYPMFMAILIFGGSLEFVAVSMLLSPFAPLASFVLALMIQCRHLFYGIAMLERYKGMGWKKFFLIFGLCDETFSLNYTAEIPEDVDRGWFMLFVTWCNRFYWITGSTIGGLAGSMIHFDTNGLSFVMTSMFVVIFLDQWRKEKVRLSAFVGIGASAACLFLFGSDSFMVPSVISILVLLTLLRRPIENRYLRAEEAEALKASTEGTHLSTAADSPDRATAVSSADGAVLSDAVDHSDRQVQAAVDSFDSDSVLPEGNHSADVQSKAATVSSANDSVLTTCDHSTAYLNQAVADSSVSDSSLPTGDGSADDRNRTVTASDSSSLSANTERGNTL